MRPAPPSAPPLAVMQSSDPVALVELCSQSLATLRDFNLILDKCIFDASFSTTFIGTFVN